ncbi:cyclic nucleotide-binding domain-containing protein [Brevibacillus formosus]|nr:Crp/Fnr family transcriptional regulator [Brevibacillus formosus]MBW5467688.1 cyclic nucleotide-binding domain-containing protein [Brevibacillus formosus]
MYPVTHLSQFYLLYSLSEESLRLIDQLTSLTPFPKNTCIQTPENFSEGFYFIKQGKVRLYKVNRDGRQFTFDILGEGNVFGEVDLLSLGTREMYIDAIEDCLICKMSKAKFESYLIEHPQLMMKIISDRMVSISQAAEKLADQFGNPNSSAFQQNDLPLSYQELANFVGASREAVMVALRALAREELIQTGFKSISIQRDKILKRM